MRYAQTDNEKVPGVGEAAAVIFTTPFGGKWAVFVVVGQCVIAWIAAFVVYQVGHLFI